MIVTIECDENGEFIVPLPDELCNQLGWKLGDVVKWQDNGDGTFTLTKV